MQSIPILDIGSTGQLMAALEDFLDKSEATFAMVIDRGGAVLTQHGTLPDNTDSTILAALAAGSFAATKELAMRIGEPELTALHQQGARSQILMSAVDEDSVLVTIFGTQTTQGLVRFYSASAIKHVNEILRETRANQQNLPVFSESDLPSATPIFDR